jgi:hypothetical protein
MSVTYQTKIVGDAEVFYREAGPAGAPVIVDDARFDFSDKDVECGCGIDKMSGMDREDWGSLAAFAVVAEERSFTRAAARLGVPSSALSHTMRRLEERLHVQLLARTREVFQPRRPASACSRGFARRSRRSPARSRIWGGFSAGPRDQSASQLPEPPRGW